MNYLSVLATLPRLMSAKDAADYVCGETMLRELGVKPLAQRKGLTVYDRHDLDRAIEERKVKEARK